MIPKRIQRTRKAGSKLPPNTLCVTRGTSFGNPFKIGTWCKIGPGVGTGMMAWVRTPYEKHAGPGYEKVTDNKKAVEMFREYRRRYPFSKAELDQLFAADYLACWCAPDQPCHVDIILEILTA